MGRYTGAKQERLRKRLDKEARVFTEERFQCGVKIKHRNFWTAMQHARQLSHISTLLYSVYYCEHCGFAHVGHIEGTSVVWMYEGYSEKFECSMVLP